MKNIKGFENYGITSCGRVYNFKTGKFLKLYQRGNGYLAVRLFNGSRKNNKQLSVHRLVAEAYIENPNNYPVVNHKDENKLNNCVNNLEWCDEKYNTRYSSKWDKIICEETCKVFDSPKDVENKYNNDSSIYEHLNGKRLTYHGYHFKEVNTK